MIGIAEADWDFAQMKVSELLLWHVIDYPARVPKLVRLNFRLSEEQASKREMSKLCKWRNAHLVRSKFTAENLSAARSESGEMSSDG